MTRRIPTGETIDWQNLPLYWRAVEQAVATLEALWQRASDPTELTARAFDEAQTAGHRVYIAAQRYLTVAVDNHEALLSLLEHNGATVWAPWSLIRPMFESSFLAAWVLDPPAGIERRKRGLHLEVQDAKQQQLHLECFQHVPAVAKAVTKQLAANAARSGQTYRSEAQELGVGWDHLRMSVDVAGGLPRLTAARSQDRAFGAHLQASWRLLSGFEHGLTYAALRGSDSSAEVRIPGGQSMRLVINDEAFVNALKTTYFLFLTAARLYERRCTRPD